MGLAGASGRSWRVRPSAAVPSGMSDLPPLVAQILCSRGVESHEAIDRFLNPGPHDAGLLPGVGPAVQRLRKALEAGERIGIFGDFDVDGVTATALLAEGLGDLGGKVAPYIPHREEEGHGLNEAAVQALRDSGITLLVTVDCGVTSHREIALAQELGMDVIVTDHHVPPTLLPPALSIVDPKVEGSLYPFPDLSGAGLALKLVQALYDSLGRPWRRELLELAALSTVADLVPLVDENRYLVKEGLKELRRTRRPGLLALYRHARIKPETVDAETISFLIAPRLNASGRLRDAGISYELLVTRSEERAEELAGDLEALNRDRQRMTEEAYSTAQGAVYSRDSVAAVILVGGDWVAPGIAGLVASRLVDEFHRPAIVTSVGEDVVRASARSVPGYDVLAQALYPCRELFNRYGGHKQAAGFEMQAANLPALEEKMASVARETEGSIDPEPALDIHAEVPVSSLPGAAFRWIKELEPFGMGNPAPLFLTRGLVPMEARLVGRQKQHLRLKLKEGRVIWDAMAFRQAERWDPDCSSLDVVYTMGTDRRDGAEVLALKVVDFRLSDS